MRARSAQVGARSAREDQMVSCRASAPRRGENAETAASVVLKCPDIIGGHRPRGSNQWQAGSAIHAKPRPR